MVVLREQFRDKDTLEKKKWQFLVKKKRQERCCLYVSNDPLTIHIQDSTLPQPLSLSLPKSHRPTSLFIKTQTPTS